MRDLEDRVQLKQFWEAYGRWSQRRHKKALRLIEQEAGYVPPRLSQAEALKLLKRLRKHKT